MKLSHKLLAAAALAGGMTMLASAPASAYIACNSYGDCWHSETRYTAPGVTFTWHPDDWYFHETWSDNRRHWRDYHPGRGYWRNGIWLSF